MTESPTDTALTRNEIYSLATLCFAHVCTKMDTLAVAGIYVSASHFFLIEKPIQRQLLVVVPLSMHVLSALIFGYLADRKSRRILLIVSLTMGSLFSFGSSFAASYYDLILTRSLASIAKAGFLTVAPTLVADIANVKTTRSVALACYYSGVGIGSVLGYWISKAIAAYTGVWWWSLRFAPGWLILCAVLLLRADFPGQGVKEAKALGGVPVAAAAYLDDLKYLLQNMSLILTLAALTCVCFVHGAMSWWIVRCLEQKLPCSELQELFFTLASISTVVGIIIALCLSRYFKPLHPGADPVICSAGLIWSIPFLLIEFFGPSPSVLLRLAMLFLGQIGLLMNWAIVGDIVMYTVMPTRRGTAIAFQIFTSRLLGYCGSAFVLEMLFTAFHHVALSSDGNWLHLWRSEKQYDIDQTLAMQQTIMTIMLVQVAGTVFFLLGYHYVPNDMQTAEQLSIVPDN